MATTNVGERLVVTTQRSIADAWPGYGLAEGACGIGPGFAVVSGTDYRKGDDAYVNQKFLGSQGGPAGPDIDGWVTYGNAVTNGLMFRDSVEIDELKYPIRVREIRIRQDSEGAGRRRGAPGAIVAYGPKRDTMTAAYVTDGHFHPPRGTQGGATAPPRSPTSCSPTAARCRCGRSPRRTSSPASCSATASRAGAATAIRTSASPSACARTCWPASSRLERARDVYGVVFADGPFDDSLASTRRPRRRGSCARAGRTTWILRTRGASRPPASTAASPS